MFHTYKYSVEVEKINGDEILNINVFIFFYNPPCLFDTLYYIYLTNKQNSLHYEKRNFRNLRSSHVGILQ
jgi:hypothetical protein